MRAGKERHTIGAVLDGGPLSWSAGIQASAWTTTGLSLLSGGNRPCPESRRGTDKGPPGQAQVGHRLLIWGRSAENEVPSSSGPLCLLYFSVASCPSPTPSPFCSLSTAGGGDLPGNRISCQLLPLWASCQSSPDVRISCPGDWLAGPRARTGEGDQIQAWDRQGRRQSLGEKRTGAGGGQGEPWAIDYKQPSSSLRLLLVTVMVPYDLACAVVTKSF